MIVCCGARDQKRGQEAVQKLEEQGKQNNIHVYKYIQISSKQNRETQ
jgi:hypothetical protein